MGALRPAGAVLAAIAAWALCLVLLSLLGLGGNVGPHPPNPALMPPLPAVTLDAVGSRLGPLNDYIEVGNRPLFSRDRRPAPMSADTGANQVPLEVNLTSVLITSELKLAIVQNTSDGASRRVRLGEVLDGTAWRLVQLEPRRAVFEGPEGQRDLALRVFDGSGGQPPTPQASAAPAAPASSPSGGPPPAPAAATTATTAANPPPGIDTSGATAAAPVVAPVTPEEQVEAIRRRIEARRALRAAEAAAEQAAAEKANR